MGRRKELLEAIRSTPEYWQALVSLEVLGDVERLMENATMTQAELAKRLGSSESYVSKILNANTNFTLQTLIKLSRALEAVLHVRITMPDEVLKVVQIGDMTSSLESRAVSGVWQPNYIAAERLPPIDEQVQMLPPHGVLQPQQIAEA